MKKTFLSFGGLLYVAVGLIILGIGGCSAVRGDAALRAGHPDVAAELYQRGAEQGNGAAAFRLGLLVSEGRVSAAKYGTAAEWYVKACDRGVRPGCHNTGVYYEEGKNGVTKDYGVARMYYLKAAERGYMQSQYNLASMYSNNNISPPDDIEGLKWMLLAQTAALQCKQEPLCQWILSDPPGHKHRLIERLSVEEQQKAKSLVLAWKPIK